jgi:uncharacterized damage-inducible protein DinB
VSAILRAIIDHHIWANDRLVAFCQALKGDQLALDAAPGTYGPVHRTLVHMAEAEQIYLSRIPETGITITLDDGADPLPSLTEVREALRRTGEAWLDVIARYPDDLQFSYGTRQGGEERRTVSFSVVQMVDHAAEHRNHVRTTLSMHGVEPPDLSGWRWDDERGAGGTP